MPNDVVRHHQAILSALLEANAGSLPVRVSTSISEAADELLDPLVLPEYIPAHDLPPGDPRDVLASTITALREAIPHADAETALTCARAVRGLHTAAAAWRAA